MIKFLFQVKYSMIIYPTHTPPPDMSYLVNCKNTVIALQSRKQRTVVINVLVLNMNWAI